MTSRRAARQHRRVSKPCEVVGIIVIMVVWAGIGPHIISFERTSTTPPRPPQSDGAPPSLDLHRGDVQSSIRSKRAMSTPTQRTVLVVAHYKEWDRTGVRIVPDWANEKLHRGGGDDNNDNAYSVHPLYQRLDPDEPRYVPNNGFESGVYIRYILDNYDNLPDVVVFAQADACGRDMDVTMGRLTVPLVRDEAGGYLPLNCDEIANRGLSVLWRNNGRRVEECWRRVATEFGRADVFEEVPYSYAADGTPQESDKGFKINMMCCACFAVTRERIQEAASYDTWRSFYDRAIVNGSCVPGRQDIKNGKHETGGAMEHLAHVVFGRHDALWKPTCVARLAQKKNRVIKLSLKQRAAKGVLFPVKP